MSVTEMHMKAGTWKATGKRISYVLDVRTDNIADGVQIVRNAPGVPREGNPYVKGNDIDFRYSCKEVNATIDPDCRTRWDVECVFERIDTEEPPEEGENPTEHSPTYDVSVGWETETRAFTVDLDGTAVLNTAGEPFSEVPEEDVPILTVSLTRNEFRNMWNLVTQFWNVTNSQIVFGQQPGKVLLRTISFSYTASYGVTRQVSTTYNFAVRPPDESFGTWEFKEIESTGFRQRASNSSGDELVPILDPKTGLPFEHLQYLDAQGFWMNPENPGFIPFAIQFKQRNKVSFAPLRLPDLSNVIVDRWADIQNEIAAIRLDRGEEKLS